ncbi:MAG: sulfurtransferase, partial [Cyclonatronaceae bacterium]
MHSRISLFYLFLGLLFTGLSAPALYAQPQSPASSSYPNGDLLVELADVSALMEQPDVVLIDMRDEAFIEGHIPGAVWFGGISALIDEDNEIEKFLAGPRKFQDMMRTVGVNNNSRVIIYDEGNGLGASRLFYALSLYGHDNAAVLNGGFAAWSRAEMPLATDAEIPARGTFTVSYDESLACDISFITGRLDDENTVILDARTPEEYTGENVQAERGGHIPG